MRAKKTYIHFVIGVPPVAKTKTSVFEVLSNSSDEKLGVIRWYAPWRQYCMFIGDTIWSLGCWEEVGQYLKDLKEARKKK